MFNLNDFFNNPYTENVFKITIAERTFLVRKLDGIDSLRLCELTTLEERIVTVIANCLLDEETLTPVGEPVASRFIRENPSNSVQMALTIMNISEDIDKRENLLIEQYQKNS